MPTDATGTATTNFGFPTINPAVDAPSGLGENSIISDVDTKLAASTTLLGAVARSIIRKAGTLVGTRRAINFIEGSGATITVADNAGTEAVDVTVALSASPFTTTAVHPVNMSTATDGGAPGVANTAYLIRVEVYSTFTVTSIRWKVGTQAGNFDLGIYDSSFNRLWSLGTTAVPAAGSVTTLISAGTPTTLTLQPGHYYFASTVSDVAIGRFTVGTHIPTAAAPAGNGLQYTKAASLPLPNPIVTPTEVLTNTTAGLIMVAV